MAIRSGFMDIDSAGATIQSPAWFSVQDGTGTPIVSPVAVASAPLGNCTLIAPKGARSVTVLLSAAVAGMVANDASASSARGAWLPVNTFAEYPLKGGSAFSVALVSGAAGKVYFSFNMNNFTGTSYYNASADL